MLPVPLVLVLLDWSLVVPLLVLAVLLGIDVLLCELVVSVDDMLLSREAQPTVTTAATAAATRLKRRDKSFMFGLLFQVDKRLRCS